MHAARLAIGLLLLALTPALASAWVKADTSSDAKFDSYKTWAWKPGSLATQGTNKRLVTAVENALSTKGLTHVVVEDADLLMTLSLRIKDETSVNSDPMHRLEAQWHDDMGLSSKRWVKKTTQATCIVDVVDVKTDKIAWRGWINEQIDRRFISEYKIQQAVARLFAKFPSTAPPKQAKPRR